MLRILLLISVLFGSTALAQIDNENADSPTSAEMIDQFGPVGLCDLRARFDALLALLYERQDVTGYVINYQSKDALPANYQSNPRGELFRDHVKFRNFDASRIVFINGGFRENMATEIWIVPSGAAPPQPSDTVEAPQMPTGKTFLFDRSYLTNTEEGNHAEEFVLPSVKAAQEAELLESIEQTEDDAPVEETESEESSEEPAKDTRTPEEIENARFFWLSERFGEMLKERENSSGVMIFYADDVFYDLGKLRSHFEEGRKRMAAEAKIPPDRINIIFGGYRNTIEIEFWIVPKNGEQPSPRPEERVQEDNNQ